MVHNILQDTFKVVYWIGKDENGRFMLDDNLHIIVITRNNLLNGVSLGKRKSADKEYFLYHHTNNTSEQIDDSYYREHRSSTNWCNLEERMMPVINAAIELCHKI